MWHSEHGKPEWRHLDHRPSFRTIADYSTLVPNCIVHYSNLLCPIAYCNSILLCPIAYYSTIVPNCILYFSTIVYCYFTQLHNTLLHSIVPNCILLYQNYSTQNRNTKQSLHHSPIHSPSQQQLFSFCLPLASVNSRSTNPPIVNFLPTPIAKKKAKHPV